MSLDIASLVIGSGLTALGAIAIKKYEYRKERITVASSILGEIKSIKKVVDTRGYISGLKRTIERVKSENKIYTYQFSGSENPFPIYSSLVGKLGCLPPDICEKTVTFYSLSRAALQDIKDMHNDPDRFKGNLDFCVSHLEELLEIFTSAYTIGVELITDLDVHIKKKL